MEKHQLTVKSNKDKALVSQKTSSSIEYVPKPPDPIVLEEEDYVEEMSKIIQLN